MGPGRLRGARVAVCGADWSATFTVWALASMGIGEIVWIGRAEGPRAMLADWFLTEPSPFPGVKVSNYPLEVEYGPELEWAVDGGAAAIVAAHAGPGAFAAARALAARQGIPLASGSAECGGWLGLGAPAQPESGEHPAIAMLVAALLADSVREHLCPLWGGTAPPGGALGFEGGSFPRGLKATLVGVGGIEAAEKILEQLGRDSGEFTVDFVRQPPGPHAANGFFPKSKNDATPEEKKAYEDEEAQFNAALKTELQKLSPENLKN